MPHTVGIGFSNHKALHRNPRIPVQRLLLRHSKTPSGSAIALNISRFPKAVVRSGSFKPPMV